MKRFLLAMAVKAVALFSLILYYGGARRLLDQVVGEPVNHLLFIPFVLVLVGVILMPVRRLIP